MSSDPIFPRSLKCDQCGEAAIVKAYLPIHDDRPGQASQEPPRAAMTCVLDCPMCGVRHQNYAADST